jgi:hypothetical protein
MEVHPWTKYELARMRDEERLLRAREAMRALELREDGSGSTGVGAESTVSLLDRIRRRALGTSGAQAGSRAV